MTGIKAAFDLQLHEFRLNVDLQLPAQGLTAVFGDSGCGKTTLLRCIAGLERRACGHLCVNGELWQSAQTWLPTHKRSLGYVFQEASLFPHLSVLGNVRYGMQRLINPQPARLEQAIELLGIEALLERKPARLSGGERQRVSIARALALNPKLLLMDEPLAALDLTRKREILPYLQRLQRELDIPVIYVTHAPDEVAQLADYLVVMRQGRVLTQGPLSQVLTQLGLPFQLGEDTSALLHAKVGLIDEHWHLARVDFNGGSLWTRDPNLPIGSAVRVRVLARDVSLARELPSQTSIQNLLRGRVDSLGADSHPGLVLVRVQVGEQMLIARLTKRAAASLGITVGDDIWVQVKSVALLA
ncbi:MAG TPA: molybdenum ABC transporter ATP-binding protein [Cellvibrionaceae bacterium]